MALDLALIGALILLNAAFAGTELGIEVLAVAHRAIRRVRLRPKG